MTEDITRAIRELGTVTVTPVTSEAFTVTRQDVEAIMASCGVSEDEAEERLAKYVLDRLEGRE